MFSSSRSTIIFVFIKHNLADQACLSFICEGLVLSPCSVRYCFDPEFYQTAHIRHKTATVFTKSKKSRKEMKHFPQSATVNQLKINLVCNSLWQSQRGEAESAVLKLLFHLLFFVLYDRISGGAASDKNIKENVCAQIEKNFARAKWKVNPVFFFWQLFLGLSEVVKYR